jgi:hypothetical protein
MQSAQLQLVSLWAHDCMHTCIWGAACTEGVLPSVYSIYSCGILCIYGITHISSVDRPSVARVATTATEFRCC